MVLYVEVISTDYGVVLQWK